MIYLLACISYLLGAVPFGLLIAKTRGVDLRSVGSGNIGATNVFRNLGKGPGILAFLLDFAKGLVPALVFPMLVQDPGPYFGLLCGALAIAGHNWPVYLKFKGGKGVATSAGMLAGVAPPAVGLAILAWILLFVTTRYVSVASVGAAIVVPVVGWVLRADTPVLPVALTVLGALAIWKHRSNLDRLRKGTENRFEFKKK